MALGPVPEFKVDLPLEPYEAQSQEPGLRCTDPGPLRILDGSWGASQTYFPKTSSTISVRA
jgi:hypothetical protein